MYVKAGSPEKLSTTLQYTQYESLVEVNRPHLYKNVAFASAFSTVSSTQVEEEVCSFPIGLKSSYNEELPDLWKPDNSATIYHTSPQACIYSWHCGNRVLSWCQSVHAESAQGLKHKSCRRVCSSLGLVCAGDLDDCHWGCAPWLPAVRTSGSVSPGLGISISSFGLRVSKRYPGRGLRHPKRS